MCINLNNNNNLYGWLSSVNNNNKFNSILSKQYIDINNDILNTYSLQLNKKPLLVNPYSIYNLKNKFFYVGEKEYIEYLYI
jgi:disulfide oxidoreductase YuzD